MGGNVSKSTAIANQISKDVTEITTSNILDNYTTNVNTNEINISGCAVKGIVIKQGNVVTIKVDALNDATSNTKLTQEMVQKLSQKAESTKGLFALEFGSTQEAMTNTNIVNDIYTQVATETMTSCIANLTNVNRVNLTNCAAEDLLFDQKNIMDFMSSCTQRAVTENELFKSVVQDVDQSATTTAELFSTEGLIVIGIVVLVAAGGYLMINSGRDSQPPPQYSRQHDNYY